MTQDEKDLLLKDLCARLPYNVKCQIVGEKQPLTLTTIEIDSINGHLFRFQELRRGFIVEVYTSELKPYLFLLESMTEEQYKEWLDTSDTVDWLNKNHFDHHNLIPKGSAIDATGKNIY